MNQGLKNVPTYVHILGTYSTSSVFSNRQERFVLHFIAFSNRLERFVLHFIVCQAAAWQLSALTRVPVECLIPNLRINIIKSGDTVLIKPSTKCNGDNSCNECVALSERNFNMFHVKSPLEEHNLFYLVKLWLFIVKWVL